MFNELIVGYLFLAGTGAGACMVLAAMGLCVPRELLSPDSVGRAGLRQRALSIPGAYGGLFSLPYAAALAFLLAGMVCLLVHLGHADRLILLITQPRLSYITVGAYALGLCVVLALATLLVWLRHLRLGFAALRVLQVLLFVTALVVATYTGLFLASIRSVPLWATPLLPLLFLISSASCGMGLVSVAAQLTPSGTLFASTMRRLMSLDALVIILEGIVLVLMGLSISGVFESALTNASGALMGEGAAVLEWGKLSNTDLALLESFWSLLFGGYALLFWFALVVVGLIIPLAADVVYARMRRPAKGVALAGALCTLVGGFALRCCVVLAGVQPALIVTGVM